MLYLMPPKTLLALLDARALLTHIHQLAINQDPQVPFYGTAVQHLTPQCVQTARVAPCQVVKIMAKGMQGQILTMVHGNPRVRHTCCLLNEEHGRRHIRVLIDQIVIAFTVSMVIGLVIGGIIWALFACLSRRRKASAHISQGSPSAFSRRSRPSSHGYTTSRTGFYRNSSCERRSNLSLASLTFQRQASLEQANSFSRKSSFRASTFHPFLQCPPLPVETNSQLITLTPTNTTTTLVGSTTNSLSQPEFHWSNNSLRICHSTQTPPPAYETIIKAFPES
ncbi:Myc target protein 1 like protein [Willisornis vidua]|uniref:Myc target protein 1 like protein n=1 Tax=Willisornis vidua TaxID=1566151 RepID=A0ABQ9CV04_9PASS|nr:Myc target protein 1 like protein [Willisornis vidua]